MVGVKLIYNSRAKASTILEVIISMIIILLVFAIAMMIFANVARSSLSAKKVGAEAILHSLLIKAEQDKDISTQTLKIEDLRIEQKVEPDIHFPELFNIQLIAYDSSQEKVAELHSLIMKNE